MQETNEDMFRIPYIDQETSPEQETAPVQDSTLYEIVSSFIRNEKKVMRDKRFSITKKHLDEETRFLKFVQRQTSKCKK